MPVTQKRSRSKHEHQQKPQTWKRWPVLFWFYPMILFFMAWHLGFSDRSGQTTLIGMDFTLWPLYLSLCRNSERMGLKMDSSILSKYKPVTKGSLHVGFTELAWRLKEIIYYIFLNSKRNLLRNYSKCISSALIPS